MFWPASAVPSIVFIQEENKTGEVAVLGKCIDYVSNLVYGHWLGQKGLKIDSMEW